MRTIFVSISPLSALTACTPGVWYARTKIAMSVDPGSSEEGEGEGVREAAPSDELVDPAIPFVEDTGQGYRITDEAIAFLRTVRSKFVLSLRHNGAAG